MIDDPKPMITILPNTTGAYIVDVAFEIGDGKVKAKSIVKTAIIGWHVATGPDDEGGLDMQDVYPLILGYVRYRSMGGERSHWAVFTPGVGLSDMDGSVYDDFHNFIERCEAVVRAAAIWKSDQPK